ncbi:MAG: pyridoxamine 5'-phosphate oxidase family protein [Chloroflexota bacterium]
MSGKSSTCTESTSARENRNAAGYSETGTIKRVQSVEAIPRTSPLRANEEHVTFNLVQSELRAHNFAVLSTVDQDGAPDSAGVNFGVSLPGRELALYVMTRRHLKKARNIVRNPRVSLVVTLPRRILQFVPPATIQLRGWAEILDWNDADGIDVFRRFWMGRRILAAYEESRRQGDSRICFLKISLDPVIRTYAVGYSAWDLRRRMESAAATVRIPTMQ